jgi:DNA-binding response OmpR family regulator
MNVRAAREDKQWGKDQAHLLNDVAAVLGPARVLLAEDDEEMRSMLAGALRKEGYAVDEARNGCELLAKVRSSVLSASDGASVDLVVSDIRMPGCSGLDVLEKLRDEDWAVPVILITAFGDEETRRKAQGLGATMVLDKPFDVGDFCAAAAYLAAPR